MNLKKYLENRIRGWLPKEPKMSSYPATASRKNEYSNKIKLPTGRAVIFSLFLIMTAAQFFEGNAAGAVWLWFSCILGLSLALDILVSRGKELNEKLAGGSLLAVISLGGILANLYVFSVPVAFFTRFFSLLVLVLVHVPLLFAVIAYVHGKKELSKKLAGWFFHGVETMGLKKHVERCIRGWLSARYKTHVLRWFAGALHTEYRRKRKMSTLLLLR